MNPGTSARKSERDVEGVAGHDEARRLVGRVDEQHAALRPSAGWRRSRSRGRRAARIRPRAPCAQRRWTSRKEPASTIASTSSTASNGVSSSSGTISRDRPAAGRRIGRRGGRRRLAPVARHVGEVAAGEVDALLVGQDEEVAAARDAGVHLRPAHLLERDLLADHHRGHPRRAQVHRGVALAHDHDVAERGDVGAAGGARPEQHADLRHPRPRAGPRCGRSSRRPRRPGNIRTWSVIRAPAESTR